MRTHVHRCLGVAMALAACTTTPDGADRMTAPAAVPMAPEAPAAVQPKAPARPVAPPTSKAPSPRPVFQEDAVASSPRRREPRSESPADLGPHDAGQWVIVELSVPATLSANPRTLDEIEDERASIRQAQDRLLERLTPADAASEGASRPAPPKVVRFASVPYMAVRADAARMRILRNSGLVVSLGEDHVSYEALTESAPLVHADAAWKAGYTGKGWTVAVIDSGVNFRHQFLPGRVVAGSCFTSGERGGQCPCDGTARDKCVGAAGDPAPGYGGRRFCGDHGTHVAGIVCGSASTIRGVAPDATVVAERVFTTETDGTSGAYDHDIVQALEDVLDNRSKQYRIAAVNMSLQGRKPYRSRAECDADHPSVKAAVGKLVERGIVVVASSGNAHWRDALSFPSALTGVLAVGATDKAKQVPDFSNSAVFLDFLAPGDPITSSVNTGVDPDAGKYQPKGGTSMAAPHVAGAIAVLRQKFPTASAAAIVGILLETGVPVKDERNGVETPFIDLAAAVK